LSGPVINQSINYFVEHLVDFLGKHDFFRGVEPVTPLPGMGLRCLLRGHPSELAVAVDVPIERCLEPPRALEDVQVDTLYAAIRAA